MRTYLISLSLPDRFAAELERHGRVLRLPPSRTVPEPTGAHPDTLIGRVGNELFVAEDETAIRSALDGANIGYRISHHVSGAVYPRDCALNFFTAGKYVFGRVASMSREALNFASESGYEIVDVRQGYAHCSTAVFGNGMITADEGIRRAADSRGIKTLSVSPGGVSLPPYEYGFIGGACGVIDDELVMFFGSLDSHPDGKAIRAFISSLGKKIVEFEGKLCDHGGIYRVDT